MKNKNAKLQADKNNKFKNLKLHAFHIIIVGLIIAVILRAYRFLPSVYYLHDEWRALSDVFLYGIWTDIRTFSVIEIMFGKGRIFGSFLNSIFYAYAPYNTQPFVISFLFAHILNSLFLYILVKKETNSNIWALSSVLLFATSSRYEQALTWIGAGNQTLYSALFSLLSIIFLLKGNKWGPYYFFALLFAYIGFLFKDASAYVFVLIFISIISIILRKKNLFYTKLFSIISIATFGLISIGIISKLYSSKVANTEGLGLLYTLSKGLFNTIYYPLVSFSQYIIPFRYMERLGYAFLNFNYPFMKNDGNRESIVHFILSDFISIIASIILFIVLILILRKRVFSNRLVLLSIVWFICALIPISFRLINRYDSYINSLYMYYSGMPFWILMGSIIHSLHIYIKKLKMKKYLEFLGLLLLAILIWKQVDITNREVRAEAIRGNDMRHFILELNKLVSIIPDKPVIFLTSNKNYIREYTRIPFLLGDGFILSVLLYTTGKIPDKVIAERMFENFGEYGYIEIENKGYGFYANKEDLLTDLGKGLFNKEQIMHLHYDGNNYKLYDKTAELNF